MEHLKFTSDYLVEVYTKGWDACPSTDDIEKHKAGLRHVMRCTQPGFLPPSTEDVEPAEEPETL